MKMKRSVYSLISMLVILSMLSLCIYNTPTRQVNAATASNEEAMVSLNQTTVYLHLAEKKAVTFDFDVIKSDQVNGATYTWYVKSEKGDPGSIKINKKTGVVTAQEAGTSYVYCKMKLGTGVVLSQEAKVTVRNNITSVKISNLPEGMTLAAGNVKNFNIAVVDTEAGAGFKTEGITRWEVKDDTAGVENASDRGIVFPVKAGEFKIRAISFQSVEKYKKWLEDKSLYGKYITAASDWETIKVEASGKKAIVNTQEQLDKALSVNEFNEITVSTAKSLSFVIKSGNYSAVSLIVDAPNADIENHGVFKDVTIKAIKDKTWIEYADGNIVYVLDSQSRIVIESGAKIKKIVIDQPGCVVDLEINGAVEEISILQKANVNLSGSSTAIPVSVNENAGGSSITSSVPLDLTLNAGADLEFKQGAEASSIDKSKTLIEVKIVNNTTKAIIITTNKTGPETIEAGKTGISNVNSAAVPTSIPSTNYDSPDDPNDTTVNITGLTISPTTMILSVTGSAILVPVITPESAANITVTWFSGDQTVATVDSEGLVTAVAEGTAPIVASAGEFYATATVKVVSGAAIAVSGSAIEVGLLGSAKSAVVEGLVKSASEYGGDYLIGWGLSEMGLDGFLNESNSSIIKMQEQLTQIYDELLTLQASVKDLQQQLQQAEYDIRVSNLLDHITVILNTSKDLVDFINDDTPSEKDRESIINTIENIINPNRFKIFEDLTGDAPGLVPLIEVYGKVVQGDNRFLSSADSDKMQAMYDYFEMVQTWELELLVEYYHEIDKDEDDIINLVDTYEANLEKEKSYLKMAIPENVMINKDQKLMIYTGYFKVLDPLTFHTTTKKGPLYTSITNWWLSRMCYKLNYDNWRLLYNFEIQSWVDASKGDLYTYLKGKGWTYAMDNDKQILAVPYKVPIDIFGYDSDDIIDYYGYDVDSGEESIHFSSSNGGEIYTDQKTAMKYVVIGATTRYKFYCLSCRSMTSGELDLYFYN